MKTRRFINELQQAQTWFLVDINEGGGKPDRFVDVDVVGYVGGVRMQSRSTDGTMLAYRDILVEADRVRVGETCYEVITPGTR